jgi:hypothetical protein
VDSRDGPLLVERVLAAPVDRVFEILATPACHPELDGSAMVRALVSAPSRLSHGAVFTLRRRQLGVDVRSRNLVVEFEESRLIAWRSHAELGGRRLAGGQLCRYRLSGHDSHTLVRYEQQWRDSSIAWWLALTGYPARSHLAMSRGLQALDRVATGERGPPFGHPRW